MSGLRGQRVEDGARVAGDADLGPAQLADLGRIAVDMDHLARRGAKRVELAGGAVVEAGADADQQVAFVDRDVGRARAVHAEHAEEVRLVGRKSAQALERRDRRHAGARGEVAQRPLGPGDGDAAAEIEDRLLAPRRSARSRAAIAPASGSGGSTPGRRLERLGRRRR